MKSILLWCHLFSLFYYLFDKTSTYPFLDTQVPVKTQVYMNLKKTIVQEEWFTRVVVSFQGRPLTKLNPMSR